jgi:hypothetical protein
MLLMPARQTPLFVLVAVVVAVTSPGRAAEVDSRLADEEKTLQEAKIATDGPSLLKFFQQRTLSEAGRIKLAETVRLLGDRSFQVRKKAFKDLLLAGRPALAMLRPAQNDADPEIARSAETLVKRIESGSDMILTMAGARVLAARKPAGATEALLAYVPMVDEESTEEVVLHALAAVGLRDGKINPALTAALRDKDPSRRAAAAFIHGQGGSAQPELRKALHPLLTDSDARVRFHAAMPLVRSGDKTAVGPLLTVLTEGPESMAAQVEGLLYQIAGDQPPKEGALGITTAERRKCRESWTAWWMTNEVKVDLAKINLKTTLRGLNLVCECGAGKHPSGYVWEFGRDGKMRWEFDNTNTPVDVQVLPGGRVLLTEFSGSEVTERDRKGKVLWSHRFTGSGRSCQRLPNGNTFIASNTMLTEVTRGGKTVYAHTRAENIFRARKLHNGHILYVSGRGRIVEMTTAGKDVRSIAVPGGTGIWADADLLPNGRYLVGVYSANKVMELDSAGKAHLQITVQTPSSVNRLPSGHIVVTSMDARRVVEFNAAGREVWHQTTPGRPFCVRRY